MNHRIPTSTKGRWRVAKAVAGAKVDHLLSEGIARADDDVAGHPVTAKSDGAQEPFIQVTQIPGGTFVKDRKTIPPFHWHTSPCIFYHRRQHPGIILVRTREAPLVYCDCSY